MGDVKNINQLLDALDKELSWRKKEIGAFNLASKRGGVEAKFFVRAGIALLYAHWEGFVKSASELYLNFIHNQRISYRDLKSCFSVIGLKGKLEVLNESRQVQPNVEAFEFVRSKMDEIAHLKLSSAIRTDSNLKSPVFENIVKSVGLDIGRYETKFNLIDVGLVKRRNQIAHGEYLDIGGREFGELIEEVLLLMEHYKTDITNAAVDGSYKERP
jgi:MAE_28990/MAE_18760-like HEPN